VIFAKYCSVTQKIDGLRSL